MVALILFTAVALATSAHPLHTTLTELSVDPSRHSVRAEVRVFADDIGAALAHQSKTRAAAGLTNVTDTQASAYVLAAVSIADRTSKPVALKACGVKRSGDLLWVCVEGDFPGDGRGLSLRDAVLCELFPDQVNIVQASNTGGPAAAPRSILFTRGDGAKIVL